MKPQIPWLRVFVEGVVIVGSILLAFGIDAWWDERGERAREQEILAGLEQDLIFNLDQIQSVIDEHLWYEERLVELEAASEDELARVPFDSSGLYLRPLAVSFTFEARDGTLDGVISSGDLDLILNPQIRSALRTWSSMVDDLEDETAALEAVDALVLERMTALGGPWSGEAGLYNPLPSEPLLRDAWLRLPEPDLPALVNDEPLMALTRRKRFASLVYLFVLIRLKETGEEALALIQADS